MYGLYIYFILWLIIKFNEKTFVALSVSFIFLFVIPTDTCWAIIITNTGYNKEFFYFKNLNFYFINKHEQEISQVDYKFRA